MKVHFVCTGNTFRSRMAMAYLNSKMIDGLEVSSSGIQANKDENGPIEWYSQRIIEKNKLVPFESMSWVQTSKEVLDGQDWVIFMEQLHHDQCVQRFGFDGSNYEIWGIKDLESDNESDPTKMLESEEIYKKITSKVDDFISRKIP